MADAEGNRPHVQRKKYRCPCCGNYTLETVGEYDICPVCYWEDDASQESDPRMSGGANEPCLLEARKNYKKFGACEERFLKYVREALPEELEDEQEE